MDRFISYARQVEELGRRNSTAHHDRTTAFVCDDELLDSLCQELPTEERRSKGLYFTPTELASWMLESASVAAPEALRSSVYLDPSCGVGNLLLAVSRRVSSTSHEAPYLCGVEIDPTLARITRGRMRLQRQTVQRFGLAWGGSAISAGDGLANRRWPSRKNSVTIIMNPPYDRVRLSKARPWAGGRITKAALFVDHYLGLATPGDWMILLLPEVLRSGSRYSEWRTTITDRANIRLIAPGPQFSEDADIHVFLLVLHVSKNGATRSGSDEAQDRWSSMVPRSGTSVSDSFEVRIGSVVDYRSKHDGQWCPYATTATIPARREIFSESIGKKRRFKGTLFTPPFVVLRRTSRPGGKKRMSPSLIRGHRPVAVENHLIVLTPRTGGLRRCRQLLKLLQTPSISEWMNARLRCRHLTVKAVQEIPWLGDG